MVVLPAFHPGGEPREDSLNEAASALRSGGIVAIPTDTVYGLAALPGIPEATAAIFEAKGRPADLELPVLVSGIEQAESIAVLETLGRALAMSFWPGGLTIVCPRRSGAGLHLGGDESSVGIRCPADRFAASLVALAGPLATTSANPHGMPPLCSAGEIAAAVRSGELWGVPVVLVDGGERRGRPSTVVDVRGGVLRCLREGSVALEPVMDVAGRPGSDRHGRRGSEPVMDVAGRPDSDRHGRPAS